MRARFTVLSLLFTVWAFSQTQVQFSEPTQFFDASEGFLNIGILVNNIDQYPLDDPIILQLSSNLEDIDVLGITATQTMDKTIFPDQYTGLETIRIPVNVKSLEEMKSFNLFLRKKGDNESFGILQGLHTVIISKSNKNTSYVGISSIPGIALKTDFLLKGKIEIPFRIETHGNYLPVEADNAIAKVKITGIEKSEGLNEFPLTGAGSTHTFRVEKSRTPEIYKVLRKKLADGEQLELEISQILHKSDHRIEIDRAKRSVKIGLRKDAGSAYMLSPIKTNALNTEQKETDSLDARYSFYAGINFDFNNNFQFEEAYYEVDVSLYNLFKNRWGLRAGIYKNNNSRSLKESFRYEWVNNDLVEHNDTDIIYTSRILDVVANVSTESLGFYFELPYKVIGSGSFSAFISPHIELIKRIEKYTYEVVGESTEETIIVPVNTIVTSLKYAELWKESTTQYWDSYLGLSFPMLYRSPDKGFEVFINPIGGAGYPQQAADSVLYDSVNSSGASFFGVFQFYLAVTAREAVGIKLGADVRKYFFTEQKPTISVNISTKLDLAGIMNLTGGR